MSLVFVIWGERGFSSVQYLVLSKEHSWILAIHILYAYLEKITFERNI
jgi:hypothetical protein